MKYLSEEKSYSGVIELKREPYVRFKHKDEHRVRIEKYIETVPFVSSSDSQQCHFFHRRALHGAHWAQHWVKMADILIN